MLIRVRRAPVVCDQKAGAAGDRANEQDDDRGDGSIVAIETIIVSLMANVNEHTKGVGERLGSGTELTFSINRADPTPLHEQVAAEIRRAIAEGEAGPGDRIPQARDLATVLGVNNNTVLRALARCACSVTKGCSRSDAAARSASPAVPIAVL